MTNLDDIIASLATKGSKAALKSADSIVLPNAEEGDTKESILESSSTSQVEPSLDVPQENQLILTEEFKEAFQLIDSKAPFVFITGRAGTGKSTFTQLLKSRLKSYAVVAPTGVAALNIGGQTIHSFFRIPPGPIDFSKIERVKNRRAYQALEVVIIDEISMVRADLLDAIDIMLRRNAAKPGQPFGGVQIIAVGDLFQLPPIVATAEEKTFIEGAYQSPFFFSAHCLQEITLEVRHFTRVFRQREADFIEMLNCIREGRELSKTLALLEERVSVINTLNFDGIVLSGDNQRAAMINQQRLTQIKSASRSFLGKISGDFRVDQNRLPAPLELTLKVGSQVMFVKNDSERKWVNGTLGTVKEIGTDYVNVEINEALEGRLVQVKAQQWENLKYVFDLEENVVKPEKIGSYEQLPLMLAWAVTIHKSQGKSFDRVHIDLSRGAFAEGQVYVALSRCRTLAGVTLEKKIIEEDIHLNEAVVQFCRDWGC
jgi:hypothetical protein